MGDETLMVSLANIGFIKTLFEAIPCGVLVCDEERRIRAVSNVMEMILALPSKSVIGKRGGEAFGCIYARTNAGACGELAECEECEARMLAFAALSKGTRQRGRVVVRLSVNGILRDVDLMLSATPFRSNGETLVLIIVEDVGKLEAFKQKRYSESPDGIIGESSAIREVVQSIQEVAPTSAPVLIQGETGTGKELVALAIHRQSARVARNYVPVNCAALPHGLLESELFGHVRGAFTGAVRDKKGRFDLADGGTIFLDEIGELDLTLQTKLLRILQEGNFEPLGSLQTRHVDVRVVSATNKNLLEEVEKKNFRADLYYRLCVVPINIPPLRERVEDIPLLAEHFLRIFAELFEFAKPAISPEALKLLMQRDWPGNVRELKNVIQFAVIKSRGRLILPEDLPPSHRVPGGLRGKQSPKARKLQKAEVARVLEQEEGNKLKAAKRLGVSRSTLYRFLETE